jgi:hypothetical protein
MPAWARDGHGSPSIGPPVVGVTTASAPMPRPCRNAPDRGTAIYSSGVAKRPIGYIPLARASRSAGASLFDHLVRLEQEARGDRQA